MSVSGAINTAAPTERPLFPPSIYIFFCLQLSVLTHAQPYHQMPSVPPGDGQEPAGYITLYTLGIVWLLSRLTGQTNRRYTKFPPTHLVSLKLNKPPCIKSSSKKFKEKNKWKQKTRTHTHTCNIFSPDAFFITQHATHLQWVWEKRGTH